MNRRAGKSLEKLTRECIAGDERSWRILIDILAPLVFSICKKSLLSRDESFDIFGQVSLQLVNSIGSLKSPDKILSFVTTITRRKIYSLYQQMNAQTAVDPDNLADIPDMSSPNPESNYESSRLREILFEALNRLSQKEYELMMLLFFDQGEPTYKEISRKLSIPVSSVGPTRAKALMKLRRILGYRKFKL